MNTAFRVFFYLIAVAYTLALALIMSKQGIAIRPDQCFTVLLLLVCATQRKKSIMTFLMDWFPALGFLVAYDLMRGVAPMVYGKIHVAEPYEWELFWFGWMAGGDIPAFALQAWKQMAPQSFAVTAVSVFSAFFYLLHFVAPMVLMWLFWRTEKDRKMFYRFTYTITVLNIMALMTFFLYPAAPPWYYQEFGNMQPDQTYYGEAPAGLILVDSAMRLKLFKTLWATFNSNYFAAIPSLHSSWPLTISLFLVIKYGKKFAWIFVYPLFVMFAGLYLNHHYIVDYVIGAFYLGIAYFLTHKFLMPLLFDRIIDYKLLKDS